MDIIVLDGTDLPNPEHMAMLQALYSRSPRSVLHHLDQVKEQGAEPFMSKWYVGYSHKSIGDCGTITVCAENVSMLCAKAIQDNPLYNGQEASTRYLDFGSRPVINPAGAEGAIIQQRWMNLYAEVLGELIPLFAERFPKEEGQKRRVWENAVKARAFDVARGLLPAGSTTFVAWHQNLRQIHDHLSLMRHNPCAEIREVAGRIHEEVLKRYPSSFGHKRYEATEDYLAKSMAQFAFTEGNTNMLPESGFFYDGRRLDIMSLLRLHADLLKTRPAKTELHQRMRQYGSIEFQFMMDFGSYRDLQRHRSCVQEMPLLTTKHGFHPWYLEQLPESLRLLALEVSGDLEQQIAALDIHDAERQYYVAMGYASPIKITCSLPSAVYIAELRSGTTVHPTVRKVAQQMGEALKTLIPILAMHHDMSEGVWDVKRGTQDITAKTS